MFARLKSPGYQGHWLGTDEVGRDLWSRILYGGRLSLLCGVAPVTLALIVGGSLGLLAGYRGGIVNSLIMRSMDVLYAFPSILLAIAICGMLGSGLGNTILALTVTFIPPVVRITETVTTQVRSFEFVEAARASGARPLSIIRFHILNNVLGPILVYATSLISISIILAAGLELPGARRHSSRCRMGPDAEQLAAGDLGQSAGGGPSRGDDLHHIDVLQPDERRAAQRHGRADMRARVMSSDVLLEVRNLKRYFPDPGRAAAAQDRDRAGGRRYLVHVRRGETLGIVGELGCGKSTTARLLIQLLAADAGTITFEGQAVGTSGGMDVRDLRRQVQMVFQDSYSSLNPRCTIEDTIAYGPSVHGLSWEAARQRAQEILAKVGLDPASVCGALSRMSFQVASASASTSPARSRSSRRSSSSTSRSRRSTSRSRRRC